VSRILLDTSAYSAFRRNHAGIKQEIQEADQVVLTAIVLGELHAGFVQGTKAEKNRSELDEFLAFARVQVVDVSSETAERYALIVQSLVRAGTPIPTNDIWIAASAMQHGLRLVTTDAHYRKVPHVVLAYHEVE
jgi:predicted nucleic acid-binding protein